MDVLPNTEVLGPFLKQMVDHLLGLLLLEDGEGQGHLLPLGLLPFGHLARLLERLFFFKGISEGVWLLGTMKVNAVTMATV